MLVKGILTAMVVFLAIYYSVKLERIKNHYRQKYPFNFEEIMDIQKLANGKEVSEVRRFYLWTKATRLIKYYEKLNRRKR